MVIVTAAEFVCPTDARRVRNHNRNVRFPGVSSKAKVKSPKEKVKAKKEDVLIQP